MHLRYFATILAIVTIALGCDPFEDDDSASTDSDTDTDGDTDTDKNSPTLEWTYVLPVEDGIQEASDFPLALSSDGTIYITSSPFGNGALLHAIDENGEHKWVNDDLPIKWSDSCIHPILSEDTNTIYVVCYEEIKPDYLTRVYAISSNGDLLWSEDMPVLWEQVHSAGLYTTGAPPVDHLLIMTSSTASTNGIYQVDSNGTWGKPYLVKNSPLLGMAIDTDNSIFVRTRDARLYKLNSDFSQIWMHTQSSPPSAMDWASLSIGPDGTAYLLSDNTLMFAIAENASGVPYEKWIYQAEVGPMSEPIFGADGTIYVYEKWSSTIAISPDDGSQLWSIGSYHTQSSAITALEDGTIIAAGNTGHGGYDNEGNNTWTVSSAGDNCAIVGEDGNFYVNGQSGDTMYINAVFAYDWNIGPSTGWYRGHANNANTRKAGP